MAAEGIANTVPIAFRLGGAQHGWIAFIAQAGDQEARAACSDVYDPFDDLAHMFTEAANGRAGSCIIDEEGSTVLVRIDCEPGEMTGRFRMYHPGAFGEVEELLLDVPVDILQAAKAWFDTFTTFADTYDPDHWRPEPVSDGCLPPRTLADVNMHGLRYTLAIYGLHDGDGMGVPEDYAAAARARYADACGGLAAGRGT